MYNHYFLKEPNGVYSKLDPIDEQYAGLGVLEDKDLLEFARQIAAGMVGRSSNIKWPHRMMIMYIYRCYILILN